MSIVAERIRKIRERHRMTQEEMAICLNVSQPMISGWEKGKFEPGCENLLKISHLLHTSPNYLLGFKPMGIHTAYCNVLQAVANDCKNKAENTQHKKGIGNVQGTRKPSEESRCAF